MSNKYDFLVVGSGFFGSSFAWESGLKGKSCWVIDKNEHVAGAAHDQVIHNTIVSSYGAHILHSNDNDTWDFLCQFDEMIPFINKPKVLSQGRVFSFPINLMTLHQLWGVTTPDEAWAKLESVRVPCTNPRNFEEWALSMVGREIYEKFFYGYTKKQWMKEPSELPASIIRRLPIRLTYDEDYFGTPYQGMPKHGFSHMVKNMLSLAKVTLGLNFDSIKNNWQDYARHLIYTGPIDAFFNYEFGKLEYHTLNFEHEVRTGDFQGNAVVNHVDITTPYIRSIEHRHFRETTPKHYGPKQDSPTIVSYDYPIAFKDHPEPYYPVRDEANTALYEKYAKLSKGLKNVTFGGRLGEYKYLDIDQTVASALHKVRSLCS